MHTSLPGFSLVRVPSTNMEAAGFMTYTAASREVVTERFGFTFKEQSCCLSLYIVYALSMYMYFGL